MKSRISTPVKPQLYTAFTGLNTSRADISMERPEAQALVEMDNLWCSNKGFISNEPGLSPFLQTEKAAISHVRFLDSDSGLLAYAANISGGVSLRASSRGAAVEKAYPAKSIVSSALLNGRLVFAAGTNTMYSYDGSSFRAITSPAIAGGRYVTQVQTRLAVAGFQGNPNEIVVSRANSDSIFHTEEDPQSAVVTRGFRFNVQNFISTAEKIRGIGAYEANKFAVFTGDRVLVYLADPDLNLWTLDTRVNVRYGAISHRSIVSVGDELFFCSRSGVHSLRRSSLNGNTVFTTPMSDDVTELYQSLVQSVPNKEDISAFFHPEEGRLHIFFPVNNLLSYRLSAALTPAMAEDQVNKPRWSLTTFSSPLCGDNLAGRTIYGTISGMFTSQQWWDRTSANRGNGVAKTPILWHKDFINQKTSSELVVYASGSGRVIVDTYDETNRQMSTVIFDLPDTDQADFTGVPLQRQFTRPFRHSYLGVRMEIKVESDKQLRIFGVGVLTIQEQ